MRRKLKRREFIVGLLTILALSVCGYKLWDILHCNQQEKKFTQLREEAYLISSSEAPYEETEQNRVLGAVGVESGLSIGNVDFNRIQETNPDIYAWIHLEALKIDYPILQNVEDNYYLKRNLDGSSGLPGCIYTNACHAKNFSSWNTVIYGHNMKNGTMFGSLYMLQDRFDEIEYITITTQSEELRYHIYAAVSFEDVYLPDAYDETKQEERQRFLEDIRAAADQNHIRTQMDVSSEDHLITLSTCIKGQSDKRYLVIAVLE